MLFDNIKALVKDEEKIKELIRKTSKDDLCSQVSSVIRRSDFPVLLKALSAAFGNAENEQKKKCLVVQAVFNTLRATAVSSSCLNGIVSTIVHDLPNYSKTQLLKLVDYCIASMRKEEDESKSWKDLIPPLLELLEEEKYIHYRGGELSGPEFKSVVIKSICSDDWNPKILIALSQMFREIPMGKEEHNAVIKTLCEKLLQTEINEIPPLVHQLLRLTTEHDCKLLLISLRQYFAQQYALTKLATDADSYEQIDNVITTLKNIQDIEGTVFYYIYQATQLKQQIMKEFLRFLKNNTNAPEFILDPFTTSVLLVVSEFHKDLVFDILKSAVVRQMQDEEKRKHSMWLKTVIDKEWLVINVMEKVIENSNTHSSLVLYGMMNFAFVLMSVGRKSKEETSTGQMGLQILKKIIDKKYAAGSEILQRLVNNITEGGASIAHYTDCLAFMCSKKIPIILEHQSWILQLLEELSLLQTSAAAQVIYAVMPLIRYSSKVRDSLVVILRKCLYHKGTLTREVAITGFLELLKQIKANSSLAALSQSSSSSATSSAASSVISTQVELHGQRSQIRSNNLALSKEVLGILKKCFSQQVEVRLRMYHGLYDVIDCNPDLAESITKMLLDHFLEFYESDENILPPVLLGKCTTPHGADVIIQEPVGDLIFSLQKIYLKTASRETNSIQKLSVILESLCTRMAKLELEHLQIDDGVEFFDDLPKALTKLQALKLCLTIYETLISFRIESWSLETIDHSTNINSLHKGYSRLVEFIKKVNKPKKDAKKKDKKKNANDTTVATKKSRTGGIAIKVPNTIITMDIISKTMPLLYHDSVPWASKQESSNLRKRIEFHHFVLQTCIQLMQNLKTSKESDLETYKKKYIKDHFSIAEIIYNEIVLKLVQVQNFDPQCALLGLECFKEMCEIICTLFPGELSKFLSAISNCQEKSSRLDSQIQNVLFSILDILKIAIAQEANDDPWIKKMPVILMETTSYLIHKMSFEHEDDKKVVNWLHDLAKEVKSNSIASIIVKLLLFGEECVDPEGKILSELCAKLCLTSGQIEEVEFDTEPQLDIVYEATIFPIYSLVNQFLRQKLNNVVWFLGRLKAEQAMRILGLVEESARDSIEEKDRKLCGQLNVILKIMETFTTIDLDNFGSQIDATFKNLHLMYNTLDQLVNYFHDKSMHSVAFHPVGFIAVIQGAGKALKRNFYNLITNTEVKQNSGKSNDLSVQRNKVLRETKSIPSVVLELEKFQKDLLLLGKKTGIDLERYTKYSVCRDFRIGQQYLLECLQNEDGSTQNSSHASVTDTTGETDAERDSSIGESSNMTAECPSP